VSTPKELAVLALGKLKKEPPSDGDGPDSEGADDYDPAKASMQAFIDAVKSGDAGAALDAYQDVMANCKGEPAKD